ncbi:arginyltransferase [Methylomarinum sp. Ch1-1]|uniref:Aspartate/glutamate leucyltransferase n=1 Tax=Methylomarinum roseum TaxID=3067653 RepID=A0AAU7NQ27_9GAMM|nr:arginyltransferase [Methylomarinum sp. Ch1-1]MDP4520988.1 arginyltransferase [Methylomarinum sp. Ch1-1]
MISIPLIITEPHECSYLPDQSAQNAFVHPSFPMTGQIYSRLIEQGFRRSGNEVYSPQCPDCQQCISVRVPVRQFKPDRRQRRCWKKNQATTVAIKPAVFDQRHYELYLRYQQHRHADSSMANSSPEEYIDFLASRWCNTLFAECLIDDRLAAVAIVDLLDNALSAVYTFFDPQLASYSLGTFAVLWQIEHAKQLELDYLYLGYWIKRCGKMSYKDQYRPLYGYIERQWRPIAAS